MSKATLLALLYLTILSSVPATIRSLCGPLSTRPWSLKRSSQTSKTACFPSTSSVIAVSTMGSTYRISRRRCNPASSTSHSMLGRSWLLLDSRFHPLDVAACMYFFLNCICYACIREFFSRLEGHLIWSGVGLIYLG